MMLKLIKEHQKDMNCRPSKNMVDIPLTVSHKIGLVSVSLWDQLCPSDNNNRQLVSFPVGYIFFLVWSLELAGIAKMVHPLVEFQKGSSVQTINHPCWHGLMQL